MNLEQLRHVEAIARHRHFTRAAEELHVSQSALSQQVRRLEAELRTELFDRSRREISVTEAGAAVAARARRVLAEVDDLRGDLEDLSETVRGRISIGALPPAGGIDLPRLLARFQEQYAEVDVDLRGGVVIEFLELLDRSELDAAFCFGPTPAPAGMDVLELGAETLVAALPPSHPLAEHKAVVPADLGGIAVVSAGPGSALRNGAERFIGDHDVRPRFSLDSNDPFLIRCLVAQGFGIALLPRSFAEMPGPPVVTRPLRPAVELPVRLLWRGDRRPSGALRAFVDFVERERPA